MDDDQTTEIIITVKKDKTWKASFKAHNV